MNETLRKVIGERLKLYRESLGLTVYKVATKGNMRISQVNAVENGDTNYTIDTFFSYIRGCDLYIYFAEKERGTIAELADKGVNNHPDNS